MLARVDLVASPSPKYRLNLVLPTVEPTRTFGGIRTAIDLFETIGAETPERRIISLLGAGTARADLVRDYVPTEPNIDPDVPRQLVTLDGTPQPLSVRRNDVFVATFWTTAELVIRIRRWQGSTFGVAPPHFAYVIQDYEPGFYPWSANWMISRGTYGIPAETIAVFNTSTLQRFFHDDGIQFDTEHSFEPRLLDELRSAMLAPPIGRSRQVLVYGRPDTPRNAFPAIVDGLRSWRCTYPGADEWTILSIGQSHPDVDLGEGSVLKSLGKLDLPAYASLLRQSAIGVSLMVSPHPSYPPLEMAHLGMLVLTNRFRAKDLADWHSNITTTDDISAGSLGDRLAELCARFDADPDSGRRGEALQPEFVSDAPLFPFSASLALDLRKPATGAVTPSGDGVDQWPARRCRSSACFGLREQRLGSRFG